MAEFIGTAGDDTIPGSDGNDTIYGRAGNDKLYGGRGDDYVFGEDGNDELYGGDGVNALYGGPGDDVYHIYDSNDNASELGGSGYDLIFTAVSWSLNRYPSEWAEGWEAIERIGGWIGRAHMRSTSRQTASTTRCGGMTELIG
jgi:Ca2+-binding RTX toxin-like protein